MSQLTPAERTMRARLGAHVSWAHTTDRSARTAAARSAALRRFETQVDPDGQMDPGERHRLAEHARKAHMLKLSMAAAKARRRRAAGGNA